MKHAGSRQILWIAFIVSAFILAGPLFLPQVTGSNVFGQEQEAQPASLEDVPEMENDPMDIFVDGVMAFEEKDYSLAEAYFNEALVLEPANPDYEYYLAMVYKETGRTDEALKILFELVGADPVSYRKGFFDIAAIYSSQSQYEKALSILKQAIAEDPEDGRAYLEAATAQRSLKHYEEAVDNAKKAEELSEQLKPSAQMLLAALYVDLNRFDEARSQYEAVIQEGPDSPAGQAAVKSLAVLKNIERARKPWFLRGQFGVYWSDNVTLQPLDPQPDQVYLGKEDWYQTLVLGGGYRIVNESTAKLGVGFDFLQTGYGDLSMNNYLGFDPYIFFQADSKPLYFRLRYDYIYYLTGSSYSDEKLKLQKLSPGVTIDEKYGLKTDIDLEWLLMNYQDNTPNADGILVKINQSWNIHESNKILEGSYAYYQENSDFSGNSYYYHQGNLQYHQPVWWEMNAGIAYWYRSYYYGYNNLAWIGKRQDKQHQVELSLRKTFAEICEVYVNYQFTNNDSNVTRQGFDPYNYRRNTIGALFSVFW